MKKFLILFMLSAFILAGCGKFISSKDSWACTDKGWMNRGNPSEPMPSEPCRTKPDVSGETPSSPETDGIRPGSETEPSENPIDDANVESEADMENPTSGKVGNIVVDTPKPGDTVGLPFKVTGKARVFESQFNWRLKDKNGKEIGYGSAMANSPDMGQYGPFEIEVGFAETNGDSATLEVFDYSAKDGSVQDLVSVPLKIEQAETIGVKLFFANDQLDPEVSCDKVFSVDRSIPKTKSMAMATVVELLKGTNADDEKQGFKTVISPGVKINRLVIVDGVAQVDFDSTLEYQVGGSCRVGIIRKQIEETLKQFPSIQKVVISIEGKTEDILQP